MKQKELFKLLDNIQESGDESVQSSRVLLIDGLNLFFRNFAMMNMINPDGAHIGGLGGFFRSLGAMIKKIDPTEVYVVFDGVGSSNNRKNLLPEYKSGKLKLMISLLTIVILFLKRKKIKYLLYLLIRISSN